LLGLVDQKLKLTNNGNHVSKLSVPICSGLMILKSITLDCWHEAITIASMMEVEEELVCYDDPTNWQQNCSYVNKQKEYYDRSYQCEIVVLLNIYGHFSQEERKTTYF